MPAEKSPVVLVTGASQGIGAEIAETFAREMKAEGGCRLALVARNAANLERTAASCRQAGASEVEVFACDVGDAASVEKMGRAVKERFKEVDVLINNAGSFNMETLLGGTVESFDNMLTTNLRAAFLVTREFAPAMVARKAGDIFFMASVASIRGFPQSGAYVAAKHGLLGLARAWREELKPSNVRVTAVLPGATWSPSWVGAGVPEERIMPASDVARAILDIHRLGPRTVIEEIVLRPQLGDL
jgi:short-subunit dehydrogenase